MSSSNKQLSPASSKQFFPVTKSSRLRYWTAASRKFFASKTTPNFRKLVKPHRAPLQNELQQSRNKNEIFLQQYFHSSGISRPLPPSACVIRRRVKLITRVTVIRRKSTVRQWWVAATPSASWLMRLLEVTERLMLLLGCHPVRSWHCRWRQRTRNVNQLIVWTCLKNQTKW